MRRIAGQAERNGACRAVRGAAAQQSLTVGPGDKAVRTKGTIWPFDGRPIRQSLCSRETSAAAPADVEVESAVERKWSVRLRRALDWSDLHHFQTRLNRICEANDLVTLDRDYAFHFLEPGYGYVDVGAVRDADGHAGDDAIVVDDFGLVFLDGSEQRFFANLCIIHYYEGVGTIHVLS
ncbi:MAG: hypothetical protein IJQ93_08455, partial [Bacteroidales bacterium]|nr:hypothetical protein [Bacteroidales bacterium]